MALEKSEGLILRVIPFRDTSKILTVYTVERGLVSLLAKGVRGPKPRFGAALELFAVSDLVYYHKDSRELQLLSDAMLLEPHLGFGTDPVRYAYGTGVLEFLLKALSGQEVPGRLYTLTVRTLEVLEACEPAALAAVFRAFQLKAVSFLGHRPELYLCVECGESAGHRPGGGFSPGTGGIVCARCAEHLPDVLVLPRPVLGWLRRLLGTTLADLAAAPPPAGETAAGGRVLEAFLQNQLERYDTLRAMRMAGTLERSGPA